METRKRKTSDSRSNESDIKRQGKEEKQDQENQKKWQKYLNHQRYESQRKSEATPSELKNIRNEFIRDYDKVIFSPAFRRLKDKTQVFPLSKNDHTHNRLTHSLEVSCIGRTLGRMAGEKLLEKKFFKQEGEKYLIGLPTDRGTLEYQEEVEPQEEQSAKMGELWVKDPVYLVGDIVAAACLAHDIGNPPFGHKGEAAMREWWKEWSEEKGVYKEEGPVEYKVNEEKAKDFECFEGNAHGLRILTSNKEPMNLTYAVLSTYIKYPWGSNERQHQNDKIGIYHSEKKKYQQIHFNCGLEARERHPLTYLVKAADTIAYKVMDIEDAVRLKILEEKVVLETFESITCKIKRNVEDYRTEIILRAVKEAINDWNSKFLEGSPRNFSEQGDPKFLEMETLGKLDKLLTDHKYYYHPSVVEIEVAGFSILKYLMNTFVNAAISYYKKPVGKKVDHAYYLLPEEYRERILEENKEEVGERNYHLIMIVSDYVMGMTDSYAIRLHKKLTGQSLSIIS